eukprot:3759077-Rhodomonas_salina.1
MPQQHTRADAQASTQRRRALTTSRPPEGTNILPAVSYLHGTRVRFPESSTMTAKKVSLFASVAEPVRARFPLYGNCCGPPER